MKTSETMQRVITAIAEKHGVDLYAQGNCLQLSMPHYDRLVIEVLHVNLVSVAHVYAPQPDVRLADPGIVFFTGYALWVPVEVNQRIGGYRIYARLSPDLADVIAVLPREQADLAGFAETWAHNMAEQGWLEEGVRYEDPPQPKASKWPMPTEPMPDWDTLEAWMMDNICEATDGCVLEPDGICPHGHPSWLLRLGLI